MSNEFDDIASILADIFDETPKPEPKPEPVAVITPTVQATPELEPDVFLDLSDFIEPEAPKKAAPVLDASKATVPTPAPRAPKVAIEDVLAAAMEDEPAEVALATPAVAETAFTDSNKEAAIKIPLPVFTSDELMKTFDMRNFASLVTLQTNRWHAKVKDRQAARNAAAATGAVEEAFESRKKLLVGADELLLAIHKIIDAARIKHYAMTLPWSTTTLEDAGRRTGGRLLMNTLFFDYTREMSRYRQDMEKALNEFVPQYPSLIQRAKQKLGASFDPREYPNADAIAGHFDLSFDFQPIPKGNDFKGLPQQQLDALANHLNHQTRTMVENAMQENWVRMRKVVAAMHERLIMPDPPRFHGTLVENVREQVKLGKSLNITQDPRFDSIRDYAEKHLCVHDAEVLKKNPTTRAAVAAHAKATLDMMDKAAKV